MTSKKQSIRVLYSFPHKMGADRICTTAWYQVTEVHRAGATVTVCPGTLVRALPSNIEVRPTLAFGRVRIPYRLIGDLRAFRLHDYLVARRLERLAGSIDIVHAWPLGALETLKTAARLGIPTVLERPNAHTRYAYTVVQQECERLGVSLPRHHEHAFKEDVLAWEEAEYALATRLLCPSDFVARTFIDQGFAPSALARHQYGFDASVFRSDPIRRRDERGELVMLFVGGCAPRKGLHFALEAWLRSPACESGKFLIAGEFTPGYAELLAPMLSHHSIEVLGHRKDVPALMRRSDILVLPSIEEGSALVTSEARGSGCVLLVSDAAGAICEHDVNAMVHHAGDVNTLNQHISLLHADRNRLEALRAASFSNVHQLTWTHAGQRLMKVYEETVQSRSLPRLDRPTLSFAA